MKRAPLPHGRGGRDRLASAATATAIGLVGSRLLPSLPDRVHPVARFGRAMGAVEQTVWRDDRRAGLVHVGVGVTIAIGAAAVVRSTAVVVAVCAAGHQLRSTAADIADHLERGDLEAARTALPALVGRDPSTLDASGIAAAAIESVAENMVDAVFAPACWAVVAGARGAAVHRALNTMDAMVGRRNERYERFGWAAARADDVANFVPARLFAVTLAVVDPARRATIRATVARDAGSHPSPNAGVAEAAMAGALGRRLGGPLHYGDTFEDRPILGDGPRPDVADLRRSLRLAAATEVALGIALLGIAGAVRGGGTRRR